MKCSFNDFIKPNDVVCMPLYKREFPPHYEKAWNPNAVEAIKAKDQRFDAEEENTKMSDD